MKRRIRTPKIVQIGVGRWGLNHLRVLKRLEGLGLCTVVGVVDRDASHLREAEKRFRVAGFEDHKVLDQADAVDIIVPTYEHFRVARVCLEAGKDILVEKPLVENAEQGRQLDALAKKHRGRIVMVGHLFRYNPATERLRAAIESGELGEVRFLRGRFMGFRYTEHDAGVLATVAIHFIYVANYLLGELPRAVTAITAHNLGMKFDDHAIVTLHYGTRYAVIEADYFTPGKWRSMQVVGSEKMAVGDLLEQRLEIHSKRHVGRGTRYDALDEGVGTVHLDFQEPLDLEIRHFVECVKERSAPKTGLSDGVETARIVDAAYESARTKRTVPLD